MNKHILMKVITTIVLTILANNLFAQYVYSIKADSVKITNCDSSELIIENHTQGIPGFLFNTGNGRTVFKRGAQKIDDDHYLIGADTVNVTSKAWVQGGNAFNTTGILGTLDFFPLDFYAAGAPAIRLTTAGHLQIGMAPSPTGLPLLEVNSNATINGLTVGTGSGGNLSNSAFGYDALVNNSTGLRNTMIGSLSGSALSNGNYNTVVGSFGLYSNSTGSTNTAIGYNAGFANIGSGNVFLGAGAGEEDTGSNKLHIANNNATNLLYGDFSTGQLQINSAWDVGFISPAKFIVNGDTYLSDSVALGTVPAGTSSDDVLVINSSTHAIHKIAQSSLAFNGILNSSLAVNGNISAKEMCLSAKNWPDYVFDSSYRLLPLDELEKYIREYNHLPGILAAAEVEKRGIDVGEYQVGLLKKVEELTLYILELQKQMQQQKVELEELRDQKLYIEEIRKEMKGLKQK